MSEITFVVRIFLWLFNQNPLKIYPEILECWTC